MKPLRASAEERRLKPRQSSGEALASPAPVAARPPLAMSRGRAESDAVRTESRRGLFQSVPSIPRVGDSSSGDGTPPRSSSTSNIPEEADDAASSPLPKSVSVGSFADVTSSPRKDKAAACIIS